MVEFASRTGCEGMPYLMETFLLQNRCYNYYLLLTLPIKISSTILLYYIATHKLFLFYSCYKVLSKSVEFKFFLRLLELLLHSRPLSPSHRGEQESSQSEMNQSLAGQYLRGLAEGNAAADTPSPALRSLAKCLELLLNHEVYNVRLCV